MGTFALIAGSTIAMNSLPWVDEAYKHIGAKEVPGTGTGPWITRMWLKLGLGWLVGQAWCGGFVAYCMQACGVEKPKDFYRAASWQTWGVAVAIPIYGCVGVMKRKGGYHVTIVIGKDGLGNLVGIGGNQDDQVKLSAYPSSRFISFRYPYGQPLASINRLQVIDCAQSKSEA